MISRGHPAFYLFGLLIDLHKVLDMLLDVDAVTAVLACFALLLHAWGRVQAISDALILDLSDPLEQVVHMVAMVALLIVRGCIELTGSS